MNKIYDVIIVGAGPAGITAAVYAARQKLDTLILTKDIGGQTAWSGDIENYTGFQFISGVELADIFEKQVRKYPVEIKYEEVISVNKEKETFIVKSGVGQYSARTVILTAGKTPRKLNIPGEDKYRGYGVSYCATCDGPLFAKKTVAVIGGSNSALDAVLQLVKHARKVYLVNINPNLNGESILVEKVKSESKVEILNSTKSLEIIGDKYVTGLVIESSGSRKELKLDGVFIEVGLVPNSQICPEVKKNKAGEIIVDNHNNTSTFGLFAAGDITDVPEKQIIISAGDGAKAALAALKCLNKMSCKVKEADPMAKWKCTVCGYIYDPVQNNNIPFEKLPDDWTCPECGVGKDSFEQI